mmetsp:Transcript_30195/g.74994  ORF Transcript_30195/g.74994 Transcript_30195/m.74994 type:complete len:86 (-) Transcript_30195:229-486(-)
MQRQSGAEEGIRISDGCAFWSPAHFQVTKVDSRCQDNQDLDMPLYLSPFSLPGRHSLFYRWLNRPGGDDEGEKATLLIDFTFRTL